MGMGGETGHAWSVVIPHNFSSWLVSPVASVGLGCLMATSHGHLDVDQRWTGMRGRTVPGHLLESLWTISCTKLSHPVYSLAWDGMTLRSALNTATALCRAAQPLCMHRAPRMLTSFYL